MSAAEPEVIQPEATETPGKKSRTMARRNGAPEAIAPRREGVDINTLMVHAVQTGNIDTMERVMAIRRELKAEAAKEAFFAALSAFQHECPVIKRTKAVKDQGSTLYHYAPLDTIVRMVGELLTKHGLSYKIITEIIRGGTNNTSDDLLSATCHVYHEAGHCESSEFRVPIGEGTKIMSKPQKFAAASTFAKRYAFMNALGILTGDDDNDARYTPQEAREIKNARSPVTQPRETPTAQKAAQKANGGSTQRVDLEPAGEGDQAITEDIAKGIWLAMQHGKPPLSMDDFTKRFPKIARLGQIKRGNEKIVMDWIADPAKN